MVAARRMQSFKLTQFGAPLAEVIEFSAGPVGRPDAASRSRVRRVSLRRPSRRRLFRPRSRAEDRRLRRRPAAARPRSRNRRRRRGSGTGGQRRPCRRPPRCLCVGRLRRLRALPNRPGEPLRPAEEHTAFSATGASATTSWSMIRSISSSSTLCLSPLPRRSPVLASPLSARSKRRRRSMRRTLSSSSGPADSGSRRSTWRAPFTTLVPSLPTSTPRNGRPRSTPALRPRSIPPIPIFASVC